MRLKDTLGDWLQRLTALHMMVCSCRDGETASFTSFRKRCMINAYHIELNTCIFSQAFRQSTCLSLRFPYPVKQNSSGYPAWYPRSRSWCSFEYPELSSSCRRGDSSFRSHLPRPRKLAHGLPRLRRCMQQLEGQGHLIDADG